MSPSVWSGSRLMCLLDGLPSTRNLPDDTWWCERPVAVSTASAVDLQQTDTPQGRGRLDRRRGGVVGQLGNRILTSPSLWWCYDSK